MTICPQKCIELVEDREGFRYPNINTEQCIDCNQCQLVCPIINRFNKTKFNIEVYVAKNKNDDIRVESSSGGMFTLFAKYILSERGVVFGALFNDSFSVLHDFTEKEEHLEAFRGSKYVQSQIGDNYKKVELFLKQGRKVLFSGTPCQVAGLKSYLREEYDNLLTLDFICHGVPSPKVFKLYIEELNQQQPGELITINFRDKTEGWSKFSFKTKRKLGENIITYRESTDKNIYLRGFLKNLYLRPSCHECPSNSFTSGSDLTMGDYWGIHQVYPDFDDDKGCSLIFCNSEKGKLVFEIVKGETEYKPAIYNHALSLNPCIEHSVKPNTNRILFFNLLGQLPINELITKCIQPSRKEILKQFVRNKVLYIASLKASIKNMIISKII